MWSWHNTATPKHVTKGLETVRAYGAERQYSALTRGLFEHADNYTGWAFTAVTVTLLKAIGAYRIPHDHLYIYFVFTAEHTQEQYNVLKTKYISCNTHGPSRVAFVCRHLLKGSELGFHESLNQTRQLIPTKIIGPGATSVKRYG